MRFIILVIGWWLSVGLAVAQAAEPAGTTRPRIGLVLSGGGARGTAHIGVLKVLDELHVPIDAIAGTSMGAVVGGLYASGMSGREIEQLLSTVDWQDAFRDRPKRAELAFRRKLEDEDFLVNLPLGLRGKKLLIPTGLIAGQKLTQILRRATLPAATITDFDRLPTPLRVVATDLESGAAVIMASGDLTTAMRASMSAPGAFAPVERDGRLLVDGGLVKNLPVDVARSMGVDVLIVVDAGLPLQPRERLSSLPSVSNQALAIMVHRDTDQQRATLGAHDVLLEPLLEAVSSYDFRVVDRAIAAGEAAARAASPSLAQYAVDEQRYAHYQAQRQALRSGLPTVQFVRTDDASRDYQHAVANLFADQVGAPVDAATLERRTSSLYGRGTLETLDYHLVPTPAPATTGAAVDAAPGYGLEFIARRNSWGPNYLRLGLSLQDDFAGNTSFNAAARLLFTELNDLGAEAVLDMQVGAAPRVGVELYLPLSDRWRYFVSPHLTYEAHDLPQLVGTKLIGEIRVNSFEYGLDAGRELGNWGEFRGGVLRSEGKEFVRLGDFTQPEERFGVNAAFLRFSYDRIDSANFPRNGQTFKAEWRVEGNGRTGPGSDLLTLDWRGAWSKRKDTVVTWISAGSTVGGSDTNVRSFFPLGGFLNLSGLQAQSLAGPQYAIARVIYFRKVGSGGEGVLNVPAYAGLALEAGNIWNQRSAISFGSARKDVAVFFGADTYIGPAFLAAGYDERGTTAFYLFLGRSF